MSKTGLQFNKTDGNPTVPPVKIVNFRKVNDWFYRGGQPTVDDIDDLKEMGIKTIVCLRFNPRAIESERKKVEATEGLEFIWIPLSYWVLPRAPEIRKYFEILDNEEKRPIFLHCKHGRDRTGMLVAFYRMARDLWSADDAYNEMRDAGFHKIRMHHFKWAVYAFERVIRGQSV